MVNTSPPTKPTIIIPKSKAQNKKIWALKSELHLSEENLRDVVMQVTKQRSISALSFKQASSVIVCLNGYKKRQKLSVKKARSSTQIIIMVSPKQRAMISALVRQVKWKSEDGFYKFLKIRLNLESIKTNDDVTKVKKSLENMIAGQESRPGTPVCQ